MKYYDLNLIESDGIFLYISQRVVVKECGAMTDSEKIDLMLQKMDSMETKMDSMETKMDSMETKMDSMETKMDSMETKMDSLETRMDSLETEMTDVKLTIENEISRNMKIIAEGHLDLSRNLHDAMKPNNALEMVMVQVNILESKVRDLENTVKTIA